MTTTRPKQNSEDTLHIAVAFVCVVAVLGVCGFLFRDALQTAFQKLVGPPSGEPAQLRVFQPEAAPAESGPKPSEQKKGVYIVASNRESTRNQQPLPDLERAFATAALFSPPEISGAVPVKREPKPAEVQPGLDRNEVLAQFAPPSLRTITMVNGETVENFVYTPSARVRPTMVVLRNGMTVGMQ